MTVIRTTRKRTHQIGAGIKMAVLAGMLVAVPLLGRATALQSDVSTSKPEPPPPNHASSGVVKSVDATSLLITRAGKHPAEMTFVLTDSTHRDGPIDVGARVQVRFRTDGSTRIATAILAVPPKQHAAGKAPQEQ
jgi:hypothetical protein